MAPDDALKHELTPRQQQILEFIHEWVEEHGYAPSVREIGDAVGLSSPSSVHAQLKTLDRAGYLRRDATLPRAMEIRFDPDTELSLAPAPAKLVPLVGEIAAGAPVLAEERVEAMYPLPRDVVGEGTLFMLRVRGESMLQAGVLPGDLVVVRQQPEVSSGEMCAAMIDGEATVKFFRRSGDQVFLDPASEGYEPIVVPPTAEGVILGKVVAVLRSV